MKDIKLKISKIEGKKGKLINVVTIGLKSYLFLPLSLFTAEITAFLHIAYMI